MSTAVCSTALTAEREGEAKIPGQVWNHDPIAVDSDDEGGEEDDEVPIVLSRLDSTPGTPPSFSSRRLSRKQPPQLTESLAALALFAIPAAAAAPATLRAAISVSPKSHLEPLPSVQHRLSVDLPLNAIDEKPLPKVSTSPKRPAKSSKRKSVISAPMSIMTPTPLVNTPKRVDSLPSPTASSASNTSLEAPVTPAPPYAASNSAPSFQSPSQSASASTSTASSWSIRTPSSGQPMACTNDSCTWSAYEAYVWNQRARTTTHTKLSRREKKAIKKMQAKAFDADTKPTMRQMYDASILPVIDENGVETQFGDIIRGKRTIVVFIRHWFCPLCAQYMNSILAEVSPEALEEANVELIIIGNGSSKMLDGYRNKAFRCPFKMYTDPTLALYKALGLTRQTGDAGKDEDKGDYLVQTALESTVQTVKRATKMPLLHNPGHFLQLGGEFIFDGTLECIYTHRMTTTRDHAPIRDICKLAGVQLEYIHYEPGTPPPEIHRESIAEEDESDAAEEWRAERAATLDRIKQMKIMRRQGVMWQEEGSGDEHYEEAVEQVIETEEARAAREKREELMRKRFSGLGIIAA